MLLLIVALVLTVKLTTVIFALAFNVVVTTPDPNVPVVPDIAPLLTKLATVTVLLLLIAPVAKLAVVTLNNRFRNNTSFNQTAQIMIIKQEKSNNIGISSIF